MLEFFREYNDRYYTGVDNVADIAVLRTWASMAYSISAAYVPTTLQEQVLIQYKVPWDLLFEEQITYPEVLSKYQAVLLAGQECLSPIQVALFLDYVSNGGTLIVAGNTGQYNQWREVRRTNPLLPARSEGKGKIVFIPEVERADKQARGAAADENPEPGATAQRGVHMNPPQWVLPKNAEEIYQALVAGLANGPSLTADAPLTTVMEMQKRAATQETIVHFINFETKKRVGPFAVTVKKQFPAPVKSVMCYSPEHDDPAKLEFTEAGGSVKFTVPAMGVYAMVVVG
jgi:hypothetical protein